MEAAAADDDVMMESPGGVSAIAGSGGGAGAGGAAASAAAASAASAVDDAAEYSLMEAAVADDLIESDAALAASIARADAAAAAAAAARDRARAAAISPEEERTLDDALKQVWDLVLNELDGKDAAPTSPGFPGTFMKLPPGFVRCPKCPKVYELVPQEGGIATTEMPKGSNLSPRSTGWHSGCHRFRCPSCETCFCSACMVTPYHMGFDCDGWKAHQAKPLCTYCGDGGEEAGDGAPPCCGREECRERANAGCRMKLGCGHPCRGPRGAACLPCIEKGCASAEIDGDDYCNICWTESLSAAPCIKLECGHLVHLTCAQDQLKAGRTTARLTFSHMDCPICRASQVLANHPSLGDFEDIPDQLALAREMEELAIERLRAEEGLPPQAGGNRRSRAGTIPPVDPEIMEMTKRALKKYSYYQCHDCRKPYFGGLISCEPAEAAAGGGAGAAGGGQGDRALADVQPRELLCGRCSVGSGGPNCTKHGQEFIEHKCRYCCEKVASFFCGGTTHYCDVCHKRPRENKPKSCLGGSRCIFGGNHPAQASNGKEFVLGCGICRP